MPFGKSGKFSINPQQAKMHDMDSKEDPAAQETHGSMSPAEPAHMVEVHHPNGAYNPKPGSHHTVTHHQDGSESHHDHADMKAVHHHLDQHMEGGQLQDNPQEEQQGEEAPAPSAGAVHQADDGAY